LRVIKNNRIIEDEWQRIKEIDVVEELPEGKVIMPFSYWQVNRDRLIAKNGKHAVCINGDIETEEVTKDLKHFELIALEFPVFTDGRSYSHARLLRDRYGYTGELRAVGDVLRDQLFFMQRCGIDSYQVREDKNIEDALKAFTEFSVKYQTAADHAEPVYKVRHT
jgi:uncharacterized protein (DUF934 family)